MTGGGKQGYSQTWEHKLKVKGQKWKRQWKIQKAQRKVLWVAAVVRK